MPEIILSICIPTFNRPQLLRECLLSIVEKLTPTNRDFLEIVIADNSDNELTEEMVADFKIKFSNIKYLKNAVNLGAPLNMFKALDNGSGKYLWLMGDDDLVVAGGVDAMINILKNNNYSALILNFSQGDSKNPKVVSLVNCLNVKGDQEFNGKAELFADKNFTNFFAINFMSALIYSRADYIIVRESAHDFINTCYPQSYMFLLLAELGKSILRVGSPWVIWRGVDNDRRYASWQKSDDDIIDQYIMYINFAKAKGFVFNQEYLTEVVKLRQMNIIYYKKNLWKISLKKIISNIGLKSYMDKILKFYRYVKFLIKNK